MRKCEKIFEDIYERPAENTGFCPYRICPLGAHVDHQLGKVTGMALDKGIYFAYTAKHNGIVELRSTNFAKRAQFSINAVEEQKTGDWADYMRGVTLALQERFPLRTGVAGVFEGELPIGGLSSSAAVTLVYLDALCKVNGINLNAQDMLTLAKAAENKYVGVSCGKLDQSCELLCRKDQLLYLDTKDDSFELIPQAANMPPWQIAIFFSGLERSRAGTKFNLRVDECKSAAYALEAFSNMEHVRQGKVAKHKVEDKWKVWKEDMLANNVPEWYIWSCEQIQYMFPKAHAAAYVTMGWRVGCYKVNYPQAYYAAYFSIRATKFSYETMCQGLTYLRQNMQFLQSLPKMSKTEEDTLDDMRLVEEFYVRGFEFTPIDLKIVKPDKFQIIDGKLMPSLKSIEGSADTAAKNLVDGCKDASFTSQSDMKRKCKIGDSVLDKLVSLGIIKDLPKSDQLSIFDI